MNLLPQSRHLTLSRETLSNLVLFRFLPSYLTSFLSFLQQTCSSVGGLKQELDNTGCVKSHCSRTLTYCEIPELVDCHLDCQTVNY